VLDNRLRLPTDYLLLLVDSNQPTIGYNGFIITSSVFISNQALANLYMSYMYSITEIYLFIIDVLFTSFDILIFFFEIIHVVTNNKDSDSMRDQIEHVLSFGYNNEANCF
jgi:hypothetical protein